MSTPLSFIARVERVKDALGMTGIVGAGPIIAAAAELMGVALSDSATLPDKLAAVEGEVFSMDARPWAGAKVGSSLRSVWGSG